MSPQRKTFYDQHSRGISFSNDKIIIIIIFSAARQLFQFSRCVKPQKVVKFLSEEEIHKDRESEVEICMLLMSRQRWNDYKVVS